MKFAFIFSQCLVFSFCAFANSVSTGSIYYVHLEGTAPDVTPDAIFAKLHTVFTEPLGVSGKTISRNSYVTQIEGQQNKFFFNLVFEPINETMTQTIEKYVADRESMDVLGNKVTFKKVLQIKEIATLLIGDYDGTLDDAFVMKYHFPKYVAFNSFNEWLNFSDEFGFALLSNHGRFKSYINSFTKELPEDKNINDLLAGHNMMAIESDISLVLENGEIVTQDYQVSPFTLFRFFRNCFMPKYENGMCF